MPGVFDFVNAVSHLKEDIVANSDDPEDTIRDYVPWITNKTMSYFIDSLSYASDMNQYSFLPLRMQYDYYFHGLRKKKRFSKQFKMEKSEDLDMVQEIYGYDRKKAMTALKILTEENLNSLRILYDKGGKK